MPDKEIFKNGGKMSENKSKSFYCYLYQGSPVAVEEEPENFKQLPCHYSTMCPNEGIAKMVYKTHLRITAWQSGEREKLTD